MNENVFLPGVPVDKVTTKLSAAAGNELESGKLESPNSCSALAVNAFGWFMGEPARLPHLPGQIGEAQEVDIEFQARFPWSGGKHPWLDAAVITSSQLIGVESKRFEPFRGAKAAKLSDAYERPVWGDHMGPFEDLRDQLKQRQLKYKFLDATQLVKHAFGLVTEAGRRGLEPMLVYIFLEPAEMGAKSISTDVHDAHRKEIADFATRVDGAVVGFNAISYADWLAHWPKDGAVGEHAQNLRERFSIAPA